MTVDSYREPEMKVLDADFVKKFERMAYDGWLQGWHERNGGNLSYRIKKDEIEEVAEELQPREWNDIGTEVPELAHEFFLVTGSGKFMRNVADDPEDTLCIIELDENGTRYRICWGLQNGGRPTSELPSHLMSHAVKKKISDGRVRVIYHCHPTNIIALTFVLPLKDEIFTRDLWEMMTECPVIFPEGVGVIEWMVPGGSEIGLKTAELMKKYNVVIWAHHGMFAAGTDFDQTFGLMHTVEKAAEILVKVQSMGGQMLQTITSQDFRDLANAFNVNLCEKFLFEKSNVRK